MNILIVVINVTMRDRASLMNGNNNSSLLYEYDNFDDDINWIWAQSWLCSIYAQSENQSMSWCTVDYLIKEMNWIVTWYSWISNEVVDKSLWVMVNHCVSVGVELLDNHCALWYNALILLTICILNIIKCVAIYYTIFFHYRNNINLKKKAFFVIIGDVITSFLIEKDFIIKHLSFASREKFIKKKWPTQRSPLLHSK